MVPSLAALVRAEVCVLDGRDPVLAEDVLPGAVEEQQGDGERPVRDGRAVQRRPTLPVHALEEEETKLAANSVTFPQAETRKNFLGGGVRSDLR